jgi:hypothetical protein
MKTTMQVAAGIILAVVVLAGVICGVAAFETRPGSAYDTHQKQVTKQLEDQNKKFCSDLKAAGGDLQKAGCQQ